MTVALAMVLSMGTDSLTQSSGYTPLQDTAYGGIFRGATAYDDTDPASTISYTSTNGNSVGFLLELDEADLVAGSSIAEENDSVSAISSLGIAASNVVNDENDTIAATSAVSIAATSARTEADDTLSSESTVSLKATTDVINSTILSDDFSTYADTAALLASWSVAGGTPLVTLQSTPSRMRVENGSAAGSYAYKIIPTVIGQVYRLTGNIIAKGANTPRIYLGSSQNNGNVAIYFGNATGPFTLYFTAISTNTWLTVATISVTTGHFVETDDLNISSVSTINEAYDTSISAATVLVKTNSSITEANDNISSASKISMVGVVSNTEDNDTSVSTGGISIKASASITEQNDYNQGVGIFQQDAFGNGFWLEIADTRILLQSVEVSTESDDIVYSTAGITIRANIPLYQRNGQNILSRLDEPLFLRGFEPNLIEDNDNIESTSMIIAKSNLLNTDNNDLISSSSIINLAAKLSRKEQNDTVVAKSKIKGKIRITYPIYLKSYIRSSR